MGPGFFFPEDLVLFLDLGVEGSSSSSEGVSPELIVSSSVVLPNSCTVNVGSFFLRKLNFHGEGVGLFVFGITSGVGRDCGTRTGEGSGIGIGEGSGTRRSEGAGAANSVAGTSPNLSSTAPLVGCWSRGVLTSSRFFSLKGVSFYTGGGVQLDSPVVTEINIRTPTIAASIFL